jgi:hypothetical protein
MISDAKLRRQGVPKRKPASAVAYTSCRSLQSARAVIDFLGLSYAELGSEYARLNGGRPLSRQAVYKLLSAQRLSDNALQALGQLLSNRLTRMCGQTIGVTIVQNSPMKITAYCYCDDCRAMYAIDRPNVRRCPKCRKV